ncbi:Asp-tRNA(Asn)/Glu-tRNA(Gln) amidotransferase subunit GatA [Candidatus Gracilibacteria bacterium]|nr:Asp-tRNA(Asn)/Glu-tRNA(Gln) amidotransferase subunit GatA [Candidatus Gracilibacteria bacterium]
MELAYKSILELREMMESGEITGKEIWEYFLERNKRYNKEIGAFLNTLGDYKDTNGPLASIPLGIKDIFCEAGIPTSGASKMLENFIPPYESTITHRLKAAGALSFGKCNMDEFAMGSSGENSAFSMTKNPHGTNRIPGGSSSGSAAAVAAGLIPASLGTDTGGSIRQPASMCGIVGFKPSYGRNSRYGVMPMASSLDCPGTFTYTVRDASLLYEIMNGYDKKEGTSLPGHDEIDEKIWKTQDLQGYKIGLPKEYMSEGIDIGVKEKILEAAEKMKALGAEIVDVSLPMTKYAIAAYYIICPAEVCTNLARLDGIRYGFNSEDSRESLEDIYLQNRGQGLGSEPQRRSILGSYVLSAGFYDAYFKKAAQIRTLIIEDFKKAFESVDAIISPVSPSVAWKLGEKSEDPLKMYLADAFTIPASLAGIPGISLPCGFAYSEDEEKELLPVGLQILTPQFHEQRLFEIAQVYEQTTNWRSQMIPKKYKV